jgi:hypothetical protein
VDTLTRLVDNVCGGEAEVGPPIGLTPLNGAPRNAALLRERLGAPRPARNPAFASPLSPSHPACRRVNVILPTDGDETCDTQQDAVDAAWR